jgi:cyanophycinase-like exopeptidase
VRNAEAIFITGGDQANYLRYRPGSCGCPNIRDAVNEALGRRAVIGGTSAGCAVLGEVAYKSPPWSEGVSSAEALANPYDAAMGRPVFAKDFLTIDPLEGWITDTHFGDPTRPGFLIHVPGSAVTL